MEDLLESTDFEEEQEEEIYPQETFQEPVTIEEYFGELDHEFIGIDKVDDETFHYKAKDVLVQSTWELPLIIQWPGSRINFEFSTKRGDIQFGIVFVAALEDNQNQDDVEVETIEEMTRHRSDIEPIVGSFEPPCEGVVFFLWDNTYDWSSVKNLSYSVEVFQPSFTVPDADRCYIARNQLYDVLEDLQTAYIRRADEEDRIEHLEPNVDIMEDQLHRLQLELDSRVAALDEAEQEEEDMLNVLDNNYWILPGLGIRCLNKHLMSVMIGYLDLKGGVNLVSKYWAQIAEESRKQIVSGPEPVFHQKPTKIRWVPRNKPGATGGVNPEGNSSQREGISGGGSSSNSTKRGGFVGGGGAIPADKLVEALSSGAAPAATTTAAQQQQQNRKASSASIGSSTTRVSEGTAHTQTATNKSVATSAVSPPSVLTATAGSSSTAALHQHLTSSTSNHAGAAVNSTSAAAAVVVGGGGAAPSSSGGLSPSKITAAAAAAGAVSVSVSPTATATAAVEAAAAASAAADAAISRKPTPALPPTNGQHQHHPHHPVSPTSPPSRSKIGGYTSSSPAVPVVVLPTAPSHNSSSSSSAAAAAVVDVSSTTTSNAAPPPPPPVAAAAPASAPQINHTAPVDSEQIGDIFLPGGLPDSEEFEEGSPSEKNLLVHIKSVKSEQQLVALIEYIQAGYDKIEKLDNDKRFIKKQLKAWNSAFEQRNGRAPTNRERKTLARDMYEAYQQVSANLKVRCDKVNRTLDTVGLTHQGFLRLRDKYIEWQAQARARGGVAAGGITTTTNTSAP